MAWFLRRIPKQPRLYTSVLEWRWRILAVMKTNSVLSCHGRISVAPGVLRLVSEHELEDLRASLDHGIIPLDLASKLATLHDDDLVEHSLRRKTRLLLSLLTAMRDGAFRDITPAQHQRLLRVVAYVRKDDDAIPDTQAEGGYDDDLEEVRAAFRDLSELLDHFLKWRLQHQVPELWRRGARPGGELASAYR